MSTRSSPRFIATHSFDFINQTMSSVTLIPSASPFPYAVALLAKHLDIPFEWVQSGDVAYGSVQGVEAVEAKLAGLLKGKEVGCPSNRV